MFHIAKFNNESKKTDLTDYILCNSYDTENTTSSIRDQCMTVIRGGHGCDPHGTERSLMMNITFYLIWWQIQGGLKRQRAVYKKPLKLI